MRCKSTSTIYIAPDCPPEVEAYVRRSNPGTPILGRSMRPHIPIQGRANLPGQMELPDTEERPAKLARRMAADRLIATKAQKPCDIGLFGDEALQTDLLSLVKS